MTYEEYLADFDPTPQESWQGYSSPLDREAWEDEQDDEAENLERGFNNED